MRPERSHRKTGRFLVEFDEPYDLLPIESAGVVSAVGIACATLNRSPLEVFMVSAGHEPVTPEALRAAKDAAGVGAGAAMSATASITPTQKAFKVAWSTAASSQFFVTWGEFGSVTRLAWTVLEPRWLAPVVQSGAMPPRLPYAGQAAEVLRQMRESPDAANLWREIEHLEHYIRRVDTGEVDAFGMELEINLWLPAESLPWSIDSWGVEP